MDIDVEKIDDGAIKAQLRRQARRVYIEATVLAGALTLLCLVIPR